MPPVNETAPVLAGDIGGTKTYLGLFVRGRQRPRLKTLKSFPSSRMPDLESIIERFLDTRPGSIGAVCLGVAGPVIDGKSRITNLPWLVSESRIRIRFGWEKVRLLNDLVAAARAVPHLRPNELCALNRIRVSGGENRVLIAPGTGLGQALLLRRHGRFIPVASEGGHADFSPGSIDEVGLWHYLHEQYGHVSIERVLSGSGLVHIYTWMKETGRHPEPPWLKGRFLESDPAQVIVQGALDGKDRLCRSALDLFITIFGSVCGNLALTGTATGGVYLGGGIAPKILPALKEGRFMTAFVEKGRLRAYLQKIPVRVILNDRAALLGAALTALEMSETHGDTPCSKS